MLKDTLRTFSVSAATRMETTMSAYKTGKSRMGIYAIAICSALPLSNTFATDFPAGTFATKQVPFTVTFDNKSQFRVNQGDTLEVMGNYSVKASVLTLTDMKGPWACTKAGEQTGTYNWKYKNAVLTLTTLTDTCVDRVKSLVSLAWQQQT
jgi:hypothetical protein